MKAAKCKKKSLVTHSHNRFSALEEREEGSIGNATKKKKKEERKTLMIEVEEKE